MGTLSLSYERWLDGVQLGFLPLCYRECRAELDVLIESSRVRLRPTRRLSVGATQRCLKTKEAARYLGMSAWALRQEVDKGEIQVVSSGDHTSSWKFDVRDLDAWIERHKMTY